MFAVYVSIFLKRQNVLRYKIHVRAKILAVTICDDRAKHLANISYHRILGEERPVFPSKCQNQISLFEKIKKSCRPMC